MQRHERLDHAGLGGSVMKTNGSGGALPPRRDTTEGWRRRPDLDLRDDSAVAKGGTARQIRGRRSLSDLGHGGRRSTDLREQAGRASDLDEQLRSAPI
jgi:hypothetical protein